MIQFISYILPGFVIGMITSKNSSTKETILSVSVSILLCNLTTYISMFLFTNSSYSYLDASAFTVAFTLKYIFTSLVLGLIANLLVMPLLKNVSLTLKVVPWGDVDEENR